MKIEPTKISLPYMPFDPFSRKCHSFAMATRIESHEEEICPPNAQKALEWITALSAAGLNYRLSQRDGTWVLHVSGPQAASARAEIEAYEVVNEGWPPKPKPRHRIPDPYKSWCAFWAAHILVLFYIWLGPCDSDQPVFAMTAANAGRILAGDWWRCVTAITLHAGIVHLVANAIFLLFLGHAVCRAMGGGVGLALMLVSGIAANMGVAFTVDADHTSVGASTVCFGALGILSVFQAVINFRRFGEWRTVWSRAWVPLGAGVALLGIMGTGERSDLAGHAFGFVAGMILSLPFSLEGTAWVPRWLQRLLVVLCAALIAFAWITAWGMMKNGSWFDG